MCCSSWASLSWRLCFSCSSPRSRRSSTGRQLSTWCARWERGCRSLPLATPVTPVQQRFGAQVSACDETAVAWATLALGVVTTLTHQLALVPEDFFEDALTSDNFLLPSLSALARRAQSPSAPQPLRDAGRDLQLYVRSRFTLDLSLSSEPESPDDAPAVVQSVDAQESTRGGCVEPADDHGGASHLSGQTQRMGWMLPPDVLNGGGA